MMGSASGISAEISGYAARELWQHRGADAIMMGQPLFLTPARIQERWAVVASGQDFYRSKGAEKQCARNRQRLLRHAKRIGRKTSMCGPTPAHDAQKISEAIISA
ncbi:MAG: hypothetical protein WA813_00535 [Beijerinckiaceae bacterium]